VRVYGKRSPITSEIVAAELALLPGSDSSVAKRQVEQLCAEKLAPYEKPRLIEFVSEIETTAAGKTARG
jgi:acyl-coenzyme A synthetase/AMP-(fatty) acid ligase